MNAFTLPDWGNFFVASAGASAATVPLAGLSILLGFPGGLYWLFPAISLSFAGALVNAWILLVEILR